MTEPKRCDWANSSPLMQQYHDTEWGVPLHDDRRWFEALVLDGAQAGLSWATILNRRENYRQAFRNFDVDKVARFSERDINRLLNDKGIIRNRLKINSAINNARRFREVQREFGSFDTYIWQFVNNKPIVRKRRTMKDIPATSRESEILSEDLKRRGFTFVGPTIIYALMQATGMVNDHIVSCFRYTACC